VLPYDLPLHRAIHAAGFPLVYHTCGGMTAILDLIWRNECDAAETLTPREMGGDITDPRAAKRILGSHVALIGGVNQQHVLNLGDEAAIREHVRFLFETYGEGGGYICAPSDHFFDVPREKLELFARAAAECRYN
jgi:uroporphyrinogen-III decarboxylase